MCPPDRRFLFRLASRLRTTVAELLARLTAAELAEWRAFALLESPPRPPGESP